jgi:glycosyltransferase involved in cell wall biosynthesis
MTTPTISIAVTTFNRWDQCKQAVQALVLAREMLPFFQREEVELIVVDDCSATEPVCEFKEYLVNHKVRYIRHQRNRGLASARNSAIRAANGSFFSFCDDDDRWTKDIMSQFLNASKNLPENYDIIIGLPKIRAAYCATLCEYNKLSDLMILGVTPPVAAQVYRVATLRKINGYRENVTSGIDHDIWVKLLGTGSQCNVLFDIKPVIGADLLEDRITTNENKRRTGIEYSLDLWSAELIQQLGGDFFTHFRNSYNIHLNYGFFKKSIAQNNLLQMIKRLANTDVVTSLIIDVLRKVRIVKYCGTFRRFK